MTNLTHENALVAIELRPFVKEEWVGELENLDAAVAVRIFALLVQAPQPARYAQVIVNDEGVVVSWYCPVTNILSGYGVTIGQSGTADVVYLSGNTWKIVA